MFKLVAPIMKQHKERASWCAAVKCLKLIAESLLAAGRIPSCQTTAVEDNMMQGPWTSEPSNLRL